MSEAIFYAQCIYSSYNKSQVYSLSQWSSRCAPVHTSVHEKYLTVHRKNFKMKILFFNDINFIFF